MKSDKLKKYLNPVFLETGAGFGDGIQKALEAGFRKIISIELDKKRYEHVKKRFENLLKVKIYLGASQDLLQGHYCPN